MSMIFLVSLQAPGLARAPWISTDFVSESVLGLIYIRCEIVSFVCKICIYIYTP